MIIDGRSLWRATYTPDGPGTICITFQIDGTLEMEGFGPGGDWMVAHADGLIGDTDSAPDLVASHAAVRDAQRSHASLRIPSTMTPYHDLLPAVLSQRITAAEASRQWRELVTKFGINAPGPNPSLKLPPAPDRLTRLSYVELHSFGIERKRADTIRHVAHLSHFLIKEWDPVVPPSLHTEALMNIPGVGTWTAAVVGGVSFGDPDALQVGDFHVKNTVAWALEGRIRGTDAEMISALEPYRGQRHRVVCWLHAAGWRAPARGPRRRIVSIAHI